jgi:zinc protease
MRFLRALASLLLCAGLAGAIAAAQPARVQKARAAASKGKPSPVAAQKVTAVEGMTEYLLPNGLHVLLFPDPTKSTITVNITYRVGSRSEQYGETGMAHLLEHLMFKGSGKHRNTSQEMTSHGAEDNGTTWLDRTNYYETFEGSQENLKWALDLEADRMVHSFIAKKDLDSEMTVVRNEFEAGENDPSGILFERVLSTAYLWHNYGHSTIGARADIENVPIERLQAFYRTYYQPDNAYLLVAGRFDEGVTLDWIVRDFGPIPRPRRSLPKFYTVEPTQDGERSVTLRRVGDVQALAVSYHVPAGVHPDSAALQILSEVLADTPAGRLHKALVESKKATQVSSFAPSLHDAGFLMLQAEVRQQSSLEDAEKTMLATIDAVMTNPATAEEVERARAKLLKEIDLTLNSAHRVGLEMSEWIGAGDWRLFFLNRDRIKKATVDDVKLVAGEYLKPSNRTVGRFIPTASPERAEIPATPEVAALVKDYKGEAGVRQGEAFDSSPANIETRTKRMELPGGLKVALLPKSTRGGTVVAAATLRFGDERSLQGKSAIADLAADMLMRGTTRHTRQQIKDELDRLKARVRISGGPTQVNVSIETVRENLPAVFELVGEVLKTPSFPAAEFEQLKEEAFAAIEQAKSDPNAMGQTAYERHMSPYPKGDVRYTPMPDESIADYKAATLEQVKMFYADFYGASHGELAVVGDFDEKDIAVIARRLFGDWKSGLAFERVPRPFQDVAPINQKLEAPDKASAFFIAGLNLKVRDDDADYPALVLGNYMLGGGDLNSRLAVRIRQKEGLSYGVGSQLHASPLDQSGSFLAYAIYAPQNVEKLEAAFREELERALKEGFTEQEVRESKSGYLQSRQVSRAQDAQLAHTLTQDLYVDRTLAWDAEFEKKITALSPRQIVEAMRRHIDPSRITIVKAGDFAKASAPKAPGK